MANTAVAALALLQAGKQYQPNVDRAIDFILARVEASPVDGLAITDSRGTQIQRKLGPYIDTFLTSMLLAQVDGTLSKPALNARVRKGLEKCVAKIERNQKSDGSWGEEFFSYLAPSLDVRLPRQADDGSFRNPNKMVKEDDPLVATTFALHVLAR